MSSAAPLTAPIGEAALAHELERWVSLRCAKCAGKLSTAPPGSAVVSRPHRQAVTEIQCRACRQKNYIVPPSGVLP